MPETIEEKLDALKTFFEGEMSDYSVQWERVQTGKDFDARVWSFVFIPTGKKTPTWDWCVKISMWFLDDYALPRVIKALELNQWKTRLQGAPSGSFFKLDHHGFQGPSADASS